MNTNDVILSGDDAGKYIHTKPKTLANWRTFNRGPAYVKIGGRVFYKQSALDKWIDDRTIVPGEQAA